MYLDNFDHPIQTMTVYLSNSCLDDIEYVFYMNFEFHMLTLCKLERPKSTYEKDEGDPKTALYSVQTVCYLKKFKQPQDIIL